MTCTMAAGVSAPCAGRGQRRRARSPWTGRILLALQVAFFATGVRAGEATVAVASNFLSTARALQTDFESESGHRLRFVSGSSGSLHAQIVYGAPFDLFLSADRERAARLVDLGAAASESLVDYALGRLVLWSPGRGLDEAAAKRLLDPSSPGRIAMANPDLAPYGRAAREVLRSFGFANPAAGRLVFGENVAQTFAMVATGNVEGGFIARSQYEAASGTTATPGDGWVVPEQRHAPIRQSMVLLDRASGNDAARAFHSFVLSAPGRKLIEARGYGVTSRE